MGIKSEKNCGKTAKNIKNMFFLVNRLFLRATCSNHEQITDVNFFKKEIRSDSLSVAHFVKSDERNSLTIALFKKKATRANCSHSLLNMSDFKRKSQRAKEQIPNPDSDTNI